MQLPLQLLTRTLQCWAANATGTRRELCKPSQESNLGPFALKKEITEAGVTTLEKKRAFGLKNRTCKFFTLSLLQELLDISPQPLTLPDTIPVNLELILIALNKKTGTRRQVAVT